MPVDSTIGDPTDDADLDWKATELDPWISAVSGTIAALEASGAFYTAHIDDFIASTGATKGEAGNATAAFTAAYADIVAAVTNPTYSSENRGNVCLELGAGDYRITTAGAMMGATALAGLVNGLRFRGQGKGITRIIFDPATSVYLCRNLDDWMSIAFEGIEFVGTGTNSNFYYSEQTTLGIQDVWFRDCSWTGTWGYIYWVDGPGQNNSEWGFDRCEWVGSFTAVAHVTGTDQNVNWTFIDPEFICFNAAVWLEFETGGNISIFGGSVISTAAGSTFIRLLGTTHAAGVCMFRWYGTRVEMHTTTSRFMYCEWPYGSVYFDGVDQSAAQSTGTYVTTQFVFGDNAGPSISFNNCSLIGQHEYDYGSNAFLHNAHRITYNSCEFWHYVHPEDAFVFTPTAAHANVGGRPIVHLRDCRATDITEVYVWDTDINWRVATHGRTSRKVATFNGYDSQSPITPWTYTIDLPLNVTIVDARIYAPSGGGSASTTGTFTIQTGEGTPTVLLTVTPNPLSGEINATYTYNKPFLCDSDAKRTITITTNAGINATKPGFMAYVEYIG